MEKQNLKRTRRVPIRGQKINVGVLLDSDLWARLMIRCLRDGQGEGELLSALMLDYLNRDAGRLGARSAAAGQVPVEVPEGGRNGYRWNAVESPSAW